MRHAVVGILTIIFSLAALATLFVGANWQSEYGWRDGEILSLAFGWCFLALASLIACISAAARAEKQ